MWIGFDDTDGRTGGCTTYVAFQLVDRLLTNGFSIIGYPRLVRLNPNIPWKTRGNGAVAIQIDAGVEPVLKIGLKDEAALRAGEKKGNAKVDIEKVKEIVCFLIEEYAMFDEKNTNPGIVISQTQLPDTFYWNAIQREVTVEEVVEKLDELYVWYKGYKNHRGLIGAAAAISWKGLDDRTYEIISYRLRRRWGTSRSIHVPSVKKMDKACPSTFDNYDPVNHHLSIAPNSPCPVLFGIRGDDAKVLPSCLELIDTEEYEGWLIFMSNQATDEHLQNKDIEDIKPYHSVITRGFVAKKPFTLPGGHVIFALRDHTGKMIDCAAYEPTKQFRGIIRQLEVGDEVSVFGGIRTIPLTINIEKIQVHHVLDVIEKIENPVCPSCGKHMKSKGKDQGFVCKRCKIFEKEGIMRKKHRTLTKGFYEAPICARRHLSKPLKRMK